MRNPLRFPSRGVFAGIGATLVVLGLMAATSGGFPSRPRFQAVGVGAPAGAAGTLNVTGALTAGSIGGTVLSGTNTYTGINRFSGAFSNPGTANHGFYAGTDVASAGAFAMINSAAGVDEKTWRCGLGYDGPNVFSCQTLDDAWTLGRNWLQVTRTANTAHTVIFGSTTTADTNNTTRATGTGKASIAVDATGVEALCMVVNKTATTGGCNLPAGESGFATVGATPINIRSSGGVRVNGVDITPNTSTATGTATGCTTAPTNTLRYTKFGQIVVVHIGGIGCTSNAGTFTLTGAVPAAYQPQRLQNVMCLATQDNGGSGEAGLALFGPGSTTLQIFRVSVGTYTAAGGKSIQDAVCSYSLD